MGEQLAVVRRDAKLNLWVPRRVQLALIPQRQSQVQGPTRSTLLDYEVDTLGKVGFGVPGKRPSGSFATNEGSTSGPKRRKPKSTVDTQYAQTVPFGNHARGRDIKVNPSLNVHPGHSLRCVLFVLKFDVTPKTREKVGKGSQLRDYSSVPNLLPTVRLPRLHDEYRFAWTSWIRPRALSLSSLSGQRGTNPRLLMCTGGGTRAGGAICPMSAQKQLAVVAIPYYDCCSIIDHVRMDQWQPEVRLRHRSQSSSPAKPTLVPRREEYEAVGNSQECEKRGMELQSKMHGLLMPRVPGLCLSSQRAILFPARVG